MSKAINTILQTFLSSPYESASAADFAPCHEESLSNIYSNNVDAVSIWNITHTPFITLLKIPFLRVTISSQNLFLLCFAIVSANTQFLRSSYTCIVWAFFADLFLTVSP